MGAHAAAAAGSLCAVGQQRLLGTSFGGGPPGAHPRRPGPGSGVVRGRPGRRSSSNLGAAPNHLRPGAGEGGAAAAAAAVCSGAADQRNRGGTAPSRRLRRRTPGCRLRRRNDMVTGTKTARDVCAEISYLTRALKAPTLRDSAGRLAEWARSESWTHEEYL